MSRERLTSLPMPEDRTRSDRLSRDRLSSLVLKKDAPEEKADEEDDERDRKGGLFAKYGRKVALATRLIRKKPKEDEQDDQVDSVKRKFLFDTKLTLIGSKLMHALADQEEVVDIHDVIDMDDEGIEDFVARRVGAMLDTMIFRLIVFGLIIVNSVLIAMQTDEQLSIDYAALFSIFDQFVLTIFMWEILLKWYYGFAVFWKESWNILDFVIILALLLGPTLKFLGSSRILRILRVLRAFRSLRSVSALTGLSMIVQTVMQSIPDMANIVLLLLILLTVLGVSGVTLFGKQVEQFSDLPTAMFSLFICVTQDGWMKIFTKFRDLGGNYVMGGAIYFMISITIGAFVFANLVVAVVVTNLDKAMKEVNEERKKMEDTLSTKPKDHPGDSDDAHKHSGADKVPLFYMSDLLRHVHVGNQVPLQHVDLRKLSLDRVENYLLILVTMEKNLAEYKELRQQLEQIFTTVHGLNQKRTEVQQSSSSSRMLAKLRLIAEDSVDPNLGTKGDILSNLMAVKVSGPEPEAQSFAARSRKRSSVIAPGEYKDYISEAAKQIARRNLSVST
ncbi:PREDICTED: cation channel sperm-associated protein 4-like [Branchiostoma belcheri]|uniref:Cation channel sperm-associated protein 4-like n=1 Tax=Branchiostoma belcheri TaxID=7741 RepID=A0A6P5AQZ8_BRABE|nr:PREDICTED: cation channel sperm-associated protein 4-like [Branchiostoma belcheri]